jgi:hypothetical protein
MSTETTIPPVTTPPVTTVTRSNRRATIAVCATDQGLPVEIRVDRQELRYGAAALADEIMRLCRQATLEAGALRREELAEAGIATDVLDRLGLPTRDQVVTQETHFEERETAPTSWLRPV